MFSFQQTRQAVFGVQCGSYTILISTGQLFRRSCHLKQKEKVENNFYRHGLKVTFPNSVCAATSGYNGTCFRWKYFPHQQVHDQRSMSSTSPSLLILICRHHSSDHSYQCRTLSIIAPIFALYNHHHLKKLNWIFHQNHHLHPKSVA